MQFSRALPVVEETKSFANILCRHSGLGVAAEMRLKENALNEKFGTSGLMELIVEIAGNVHAVPDGKYLGMMPEIA